MSPSEQVQQAPEQHEMKTTTNTSTTTSSSSYPTTNAMNANAVEPNQQDESSGILRLRGGCGCLTGCLAGLCCCCTLDACC
ncbi:hypothetical protein BDC45DRAFT_603072 [Circinella umbellata]|nr:hypothetical protein BDC45DRAFT_603072 [Circinella umbellata]